MDRIWKRGRIRKLFGILFCQILIFVLYEKIHDRSPSYKGTVDVTAGLIPGGVEFLVTASNQLLRKLLHFSLHKVNHQLLNTNCSKWWANLRSVTNVQVTNVSETVLEYTLTFQVQPGDIPFETVLRLSKNQRNSTHLYVSDDLELVSARRLDSHTPICDEVGQNQVCLCAGELEEAEKKTRNVRRHWNFSDPEQVDWPPNANLMVGDYLTLGKMNVYLNSPKNNDFCGPLVRMVIFITGAPAHEERRKAIRETFGNSTLLQTTGVKLLFAFGKITNSSLQVNSLNFWKSNIFFNLKFF